jgi:citrate synthase
MSKTAQLHFNGEKYEIPVVEGTENEKALDISKLRSESGLITIDRGFKDTEAILLKNLLKNLIF